MMSPDASNTHIHVCSLARLGGVVRQTGARHIVTLVSDQSRFLPVKGVARDDHLWLQMDDIGAHIEGLIAPCEEHVARLIGFLGKWDRGAPLVVHCFAGISRSTAAAFISACALAPHRDEAEIAQALRKASPTASPNPMLVALGDRFLRRDGRMLKAVEAIGPAELAIEARPFFLSVA
jgi:predicted protein tyrosine phosphatase